MSDVLQVRTRMLRASAAPQVRSLRHPAMANDEDRRPGLSLTSRAVHRDGRPWIPISGEIHYSRVPRARWVERLRLMRAGGITVVSTYVFWNHHEQERGRARFDGDLDLAAFIDTVHAEGLELVLRIGPWAHGEARNGGFPDWVQAAPVAHRTDDPGYLALVQDWFRTLAEHLDGRATPDGVLGIQLDNELYDQPQHLVTLKTLARDAGMSAPLWTATAWGGAELPDPEVLPLWGGYGDGFWVDPDQPWDPTFRAHYFFSHEWDDPGIGVDVRGEDATRHADLSPWFPPATCELAGGMATAYHRRPRPSARDVAAIAHAKIGSGSAWQGYYMYVGGTNPDPALAESQATAYPNDITPRGYDFHAPIGEAGRAQGAFAALRRQHAFLDAFGQDLAEMPVVLPDDLPRGVEDSETLRWSLRTDGDRGILFVGWHQPHVPLEEYIGVQFSVRLAGEEVTLPSRPVDIPAGTLARWPVGWTVGGVQVDSATASALTILPGRLPTLVLVEDAGIPVEVAVRGEVTALELGAPAHRLGAKRRALDVLVIPADRADDVWVTPDRRIVLSGDEVTWDTDGTISVRTSDGAPDAVEYDPTTGAWVPLELRHAESAPLRVDVPVAASRAARAVTGRYGERDRRPAMPSAELIEDAAARFTLEVPPRFDDDAVLRVAWAGDVAQVVVDGEIVTDRFWDGSDLVVNLRDAGARPGSAVELRVLPLMRDTPVHLPADAAARLAASDGALCAIDAVTLDQRALWVED